MLRGLPQRLCSKDDCLPLVQQATVNFYTVMTKATLARKGPLLVRFGAPAGVGWYYYFFLRFFGKGDNCLLAEAEQLSADDYSLKADQDAVFIVATSNLAFHHTLVSASRTQGKDVTDFQEILAVCMFSEQARPLRAIRGA